MLQASQRTHTQLILQQAGVYLETRVQPESSPCGSEWGVLTALPESRKWKMIIGCVFDTVPLSSQKKHQFRCFKSICNLLSFSSFPHRHREPSDGQPAGNQPWALLINGLLTSDPPTLEALIQSAFTEWRQSRAHTGLTLTESNQIKWHQ